MLRKFTGFLLLTYAVSVSAQSVKVIKETARIKGKNAEGYEVELEGTTSEVSEALSKYIRTFAKLKLGASPLATSEAVIGGILYKNPVYALTKEKSDRTAAWIGIRTDEWPADEAEKLISELERITYNFGVQFYRDKIQVQIDEATRALQAVEKQQQRLLTEDKNLAIKLENNQKEKVQLEKAMDVNRLEHLTLLTKMEQNKRSRDSLAIVLEQVKKAVEIHKEKQQKVN
jgi:hypothetical protein